MKRTKGAQSEVGMLYQYAVTALLAAELSENDRVADYVIYSSENSAGKFDDVVAKIKLKDEDDWYASLIQVKYKTTKKLNVSDNLKGDRIERFLSAYIQSFNEILDDPELTCRRGIPANNVRFAIFSDKPIQTPVFLHQDRTFQLQVRPYYENNNTVNDAVLPFGKRYWKFACKELENSDQQVFFDRCCLFLEQPNYNQCNKRIAKLCLIASAKEIINYVKDYFNDDYLYKRGLRKEVFEIELQRIRVFDGIPPLIALEELVDDNSCISIWNKITLEQDITIVHGVQAFRIEPLLYSCLIHKINALLNVNIDLEKGHRLDSDTERKFMEYSESKRVRHWIEPPYTLGSLIVELWKHGDLPLILRAPFTLKEFEKYARLKRSYVIIDDWSDNLSEEISTSKLDIFHTLGSIANVESREAMLKSTIVSLQGRRPVALKDLLIDDIGLMSTFTCGDILRMMRKRIPFLREDYFKGSDYLAFIVEDERCQQILDRIEPYAIGHNVTISYPPGKMDECLKIIQRRADIFKNYTIYRLRRIGEKLALVEGDPKMLRHLFVDQYGDLLYTSINNINNSNDQLVSIIGQLTAPNELEYIRRKLRRPTLPRSFIHSEQTGICFLSGELDFIGRGLEFTDADDITLETLSTRKGTYLVRIDDDKEKRRYYWRELSQLGYPIFDVYVNKNGEMVLLRCQHCANLESLITFDSGKYREDDFIDDIRDDAGGISIVTGDTGMGKTSFLRWLCNNLQTTRYIVFYDLINLQVDLRKSENRRIDLIEFVFENIRKNLRNKYVDFVTGLWERNRLIWVLDSFDEIRLACETQVLDFIRSIAASGAQTIIATRTENCKILTDEFDIRLMKIDPLEEDEHSVYWRLNTIEFRKVSSELLTTPLYLNFLKMISIDQERPLDKFTKFSLFERVINMNIRSCFRRTYQVLYDSEVERTVALFEKLALVVMFGRETIEQELSWIIDNEVSDMTKFGIIVRYNEDGNPIFYHRSFVEFLVAQWMTKACKTNVHRSAARYLYKQVYEANLLHIFNIVFEDIELHEAICHRSISLVREIIEECGSNVSDKLGRSALHAATIACGYSNNVLTYEKLELIMTSISDQDADDMDTPDVFGMSWYEYFRPEIFDFACEFYKWGVLKVFLRFYRRKVERDNCADLIFPTKYLYSLSITTIELHSIDMMADLVFLQNFPNKVFRNFYGACLRAEDELRDLESDRKNIPTWTRDVQFDGNLTLLHVASIYGSVSMIRHLIGVGADVNAIDEYSCTPLHYSIMRCCLSSLERNNPKAETLQDTIRSKHIDSVKLLLEAGSSTLLNVHNYTLLSPLCLAVLSRDVHVVRLLLESGANICHHHGHMHTALHFAAVVGSLDIVQCLLDHQIPRLLKNEDGETAVDIATKRNHTEIVDVLLADTTEDIRTDDRRPVYVGTSIFTDLETAPLRNAMYSGNIDLIKVLLRRSYNVNVRDTQGETPLYWALQTENVDVIALLLDWGADVNVRNKYGSMPLHFAAVRHDVGVIKMILERGADIDLPNSHKETPLYIAVACSISDVVRFLLERGAKTNVQHETGLTALHLAVYRGSEEKVRLLLEYGANTEIKDFKGYTPLHSSISYGYTVISELLIRNGADTTGSTKTGHTPLWIAVSKGDIDTLRLLLEGDINLELKNVYGYTVLQVAAAIGNEEIVRILLENGADVNARSKEGSSILMIAVEYNHVHILRLLLEANVNLDRAGEAAALEFVTLTGDVDTTALLIQKGANVNTCNVNLYTPLHLAVQKGQWLIVKLLLERGARVNAATVFGYTPLHYAVDYHHKDIVQSLINAGADVNAKAKNGDTSFLLAVLGRNIDIVKLLLKASVDIDRETCIKALKLAVCLGNVGVIKRLLSEDAVVNIYNENDYGVLHAASVTGRADIVELLLEKTIDVNSATGYDVASFFRSVTDGRIEMVQILNEGPDNDSLIARGYIEFVRLLIEEGANINFTFQEDESCLLLTINFAPDAVLKIISDVRAPTSNYGNIIVRLAARKGKTDVVEWLLNRGGNMITDTLSGTTLLHDCASESNVNIMRLLLERETNVNAQDNIGNTPLHIGVIEANVDVVGLLLGANANADIPNCNRETALDLAIGGVYADADTSLQFETKDENVEIIRLLLDNMVEIDIDDENVIRIVYWAVVEGRQKIIELLLNRCDNLM